MTITEPGFVYIYLSNENGTPVEVFFDDFSVTHTGTDVVQKDDYYPFGGSFNAYTDLSTPQQDYLYNGVRLNKTTQLYETAFRTYDPYLGRFNHIDPLAAMVPGLSPYHFGFNNPVRYSDPLGLMGQDAGIWGTGDTYASNNSQNPFDFMPKFTQTNPGSGNHWSDEYRDPYHNWMSMDTDSFNGMDYILKFKWIDHPDYTVKDPKGTYVTAKQSEFVLYHAVQNKGMTDFSNFNHALNIGGGIYGAMEGLTSSQGYWLGKNGKYYEGFSGRGPNQYTGSRASALKSAYSYKLAGKAVVIGQVALGVYVTRQGYISDGGQFGYNAQRAAVGSAAGIGFGLVGAQAGAAAGAAIGVWFGGVGAIPGTVIGGVIGGFGLGVGGSYLGSYFGESAVDHYHGR